MKKFIITEEEKKNILSMYSVLNEQIIGEQKLDVSKFVGKTYKLYLEPGGKSTKFEWDNPADTHPKPANFLPMGKNYFEVKIAAISYFSGETELNYSFLCERIETNEESYRIQTMYTDTQMLDNGKFKVTLMYSKPKSKYDWKSEVFYGYSDELKTDLNNNGIIKSDK
jgi:hypothetical protein